MAALCGGIFARPAAAQSVVRATNARAAIWRTQTSVAATVAARQAASLSLARGGIVSAVMFSSGQMVTAGQVLVQLADGPEMAQMALDGAKLEQAQRQLARTRKLIGISGASQSALEQAEAQVDEAQAQMALDKADIGQLQMTAPFAGRLGIRTLDPGDYVQAGQVIVSLTGVGPLRVLFAVPQTESGGLSVGEPFTIAAPVGAGQAVPAKGEITALGPAIAPATDARDVEGVVVGDASGLLPGMVGVVHLATGAPMPALAVPQTALNDSTLGPFVYLLSPAGPGQYAVSPVYVTIYGDAGGQSLISTSGLKAGDKIVAIGGFKLSAGAVVSLQSP
ncbi:MAG: efflux RND transporter periplasmic adaptor subunit [Acidocella sp.]|nr:efflux RND transporter periplasmic adaptor subunit [Acidocella sp.]